MRVLTVDDQTRLRPLELTDAETLAALVKANRAYLREWMPWADNVHSAEDVRPNIERSLKERDAGVAFGFVIEHEAKPGGRIGLNRIDRGNRLGSMGYWLREDFQGLGIVTKSCRVLLRFAFIDLNLNRITIATAVNNTRSRAVAERLGFVLEGTLRESEWMNDRFVDQVLYSILRREWDGQDGR